MPFAMRKKNRDSCRQSFRSLSRRRLVVEALESRRMLATFTVTSNADSGIGTLREAITQANATPGSHDIAFSLPAVATKIELQTRLPNIQNQVDIDATTQPGYVDTPLVEVDGSKIPRDVGASGFTLATSFSRVAGFAITGFKVSGVRINGGSNHAIEQNYIGVDLTGEKAIPNEFSGVLVSNSSDNRIGSPGKGNLISGNGIAGVRIEGAASQRNLVQGNYLGTNAEGNSAIPNGREGVEILNEASRTIVGTDGNGSLDDREGNLISGNSFSGIRIFNAINTIIAGNLIGTDRTGERALGNLNHGVLVDGGSSNNQIGSNGNGQNDVLERNIISGNTWDGISIRSSATRNIVSGNYIGTDIAGEKAVANSRSGVALVTDANENQIGTQDGEYLGNLISGNTTGVWIGYNSNDNAVSGNLIGLDVTGSKPISNIRGVTIRYESQRNLIGTNDSGRHDISERNIVSGSVHQGVGIYDLGTNENVVAGNYVGTDASGMNAIPNGASGVVVSADARRNRIGTSKSSRSGSVAGNLISGNSVFGLRFRSRAGGNSAGGNKIGTDASGMNAIPNIQGGVSVFENASANSIGGTYKQRNIISGNLGWGISIQADTGLSVIAGNWIGLAGNGVSPMGNQNGGILITDSSYNRIGPAENSPPNVIAHNGSTGIAVQGDSRHNQIVENLIIGHSEMGIDLGNDGPTPNDLGDNDTGPNSLLNHPEILAYGRRANSGIVVGSISGSPNTTYSVQTFTSDATSNAPQGSDVLADSIVRTDHQGRGLWMVDRVPTQVADEVTALTYFESETSEFAAKVPPQRLFPFYAEGLAIATLNESHGSVALRLERGDIPLADRVEFRITSGLGQQISVSDESVAIPAGQESVEFFAQIIDDSIVESFHQVVILAEPVSHAGAAAVGIYLQDNDEPAWHNAFQPFDVNGDRSTTPLDALIIINFLNTEEELNLGNRPASPIPNFVDANNDDFAAPIDAFLVINWLNQQASGEGEAASHDLGQEAEQYLPEWESLLDQLAEERRKRNN